MNLRTFILDALRKKFEGVDEKVLNRIARTAAKTVKTEEEATQFVEDYTIQQVIDSYTDSRVNEASENAVKNYEKKFGLKDGKKADGDDDTDDPDAKNDPDKGGKGDKKDDAQDGKGDDVPAYVKAILEGQKAINERLDKIETGKTTDARKAKLNELLKDAPDKIKNRYEKAFGRMTFKDDDDFEDWLDNDVTPDVEDAGKQQTQSQAGVSGPKGGNKGGGEYKPSAALQARADKMKSEQAQSAIAGLPTQAK